MNQSQSRNAPSAFKPVFVVGLVVLGMAAFTAISKCTAPKELVPWRTDYASAEAEATTTNKPLFLYFTAAWCGACQEMKRTTWADPDVEIALRDFVPVKIDVDSHPKLAEQLQIEFLPSFRVIKKPGDPPSPVSAGYQTKEGLIVWLHGMK